MFKNSTTKSINNRNLEKMSTKKEMQVVEKNELSNIEVNTLQSFDLSKELPNLSEAKVLPMDLLSEYWTPVIEEEYKLCFFKELKTVLYTDADKKVIDLPCVILIEQTPTGILRTIRNGSKRLVATIEDAVNSGTLSEGTPLKITFKGKEKNATNAFQSDRWSVNPLYVENEVQKLANKESIDFEEVNQDQSIQETDVQGPGF